jgi:hypothetical protein
MAQRIRRADITNNAIDSTAIVDSSIQKIDIKLQDSGDGTAVCAETLPYEHGSPTPTIHDKIESLIIGGSTLSALIATADGVNTEFVLSNRFDLNGLSTTVYFNGQMLVKNADYGLVQSGPSPAPTQVSFNWIPETGKQIVVYGSLEV